MSDSIFHCCEHYKKMVENIESRNRLGGNALEFKESAKKVTPFIVAKWDLNVAFWSGERWKESEES